IASGTGVGNVSQKSTLPAGSTERTGDGDRSSEFHPPIRSGRSRQALTNLASPRPGIGASPRQAAPSSTSGVRAITLSRPDANASATGISSPSSAFASQGSHPAPRPSPPKGTSEPDGRDQPAGQPATRAPIATPQSSLTKRALYNLPSCADRRFASLSRPMRRSTRHRSF